MHNGDLILSGEYIGIVVSVGDKTLTAKCQDGEKREFKTQNVTKVMDAVSIVKVFKGGILDANL